MATIEELLSANLPAVPSLPFRTAQPATKPEIQAARAELEPYQRAGEAGRLESQKIAEALRTRQRQIREQAAAAKEKGLLEIEAKRPIPKELPAFESPKKTFDELFSVIMVGAMTAAGAGKGNYMAAANSMIGAMEGYQKGKKSEFDQSLREFDTSLKKALQEEKVNNAKYQQIAASDKLSLAEKIRQIELQATALDDKIMAATARSNDFEKMTREIARRNEGFAKIEEARNRAEESLINQMEMRRFSAEQAAATREAGRLTGRTAQTWEVTDEQGNKRIISVMPQYNREGRQVNEPAGGVLLGTGARAVAAAPSAAVSDERGMFKIDTKLLPKGKTADEFNKREPILSALSDLNYLINKKDEKGVANKDKMGYVFRALSLNPALNLPILTDYYKDDPDMLAIIRRLGQFESQEFQIGGKTLTAPERNILAPIYGWRGISVEALVGKSGQSGQIGQAFDELNKEQKIITSQYSEAKKARRNMQINLGRGKSKDSPIILDSQEDANGLPAGTFVRVDNSIFRVQEE